MAPHMKGLRQFISDLRSAGDADEERRRINAELHNIRSKPADLDPYLRKKYVCKLLYIHLCGHAHEAAFGLEHAYALLLGPLYLERLLGYLAVLILHTCAPGAEAAYLLDLASDMHAYLARDLRLDSADANLLALLFVATAFRVPLQHAPPAGALATHAALPQHTLELAEMVYGLCVSPMCAPTVKMRALAALRVLAQTHPRVLTDNDPWVPRLLAQLDEQDLGVVTCALPLAQTLVSLSPRHARATVPQIASLLYALLALGECPDTYMYHAVPAPWLAVRLMQMAEHVFTLVPLGGAPRVDAATVDLDTLARLRQLVLRAIHIASAPAASTPERNARAAVLFQAVSLAPFLDASREAIHGAIDALALLLATPETNTRYLVVDALVKLCVRSGRTSAFLPHFSAIANLLVDKDVLVRRKCLDLLFAMCDAENYTRITACLLDHLPRADVALKPDVLVKIALLAERFAEDSLWYVSTMLRLLSLGGSATKSTASATTTTAGEIWERILQIVVNNEPLQRIATKYVLNILRRLDAQPSESIFKVAAFLLGEYGHVLVDSESPDSPYGLALQFHMLSTTYLASGVHARPMVMTAFLKIVARYPTADFVPDIVDLFDAETRSLDLEIQARAHEYLKLATWLASGKESERKLALDLLQPLPPFEGTENRLLRQLGSLNVIGGASSVNGANIPKLESARGLSRSSSPRKALGENDSLNPFGDSPANVPPNLSPNWYDGYHRMLQFDAGIFYEDQLVKITYRVMRDPPTVRILFTIINNAAKTADTALSAFTVHEMHTSVNANYLVSMPRIPDLRISLKTTMEIEIKVRDVFDSKDGPVLAMSYKCSGSFNTLTLKVPVVLTKVLSATSMSSIDEFKKRWLQIGEVIGVEHGEKRGTVTAAHRRNSSTLAMMLQRLGLAIIQNTPDDPLSNILVTGAGILHMVKSTCGVLVTVKSVLPDANEFEVIIRSTGAGVPAIVYDIIRELLDLRH